MQILLGKFRLHFYLLSLLGLVSFTPGCRTYQSGDIDLGQSRHQLEQRDLSDPGLQQFLTGHGQSATGNWDLEKLTLAAFYYSPALDVARADYAAAKAGVITASALPNPSFNFSPGYDVDAEAGVSPWILGYALDFPLDLTGQRKRRTAQARHEEEIARLNLASSAWSIRSEVRQALIALHAADKAAAFWKNQTTLLSRVLTLVENEVGAGERSRFEAGQTRILVNLAEIEARESERARVQAGIRLAEVIGVSTPVIEKLTIDYRGLDSASLELTKPEARTWAAQNRPDLLAALSAYTAAQSLLQGEVARQYPDLNLGPGYELDQGEGKWSLSFGLTLPVFNRHEGPIAKAEAQRESAAAQFFVLQNHVLAQVDRAYTAYAAASRDLKAFQSLQANLDQQAATLQAQQTLGEISQLERARAQWELADNLKAELAAAQRFEQALADLEDAVQRPLDWPDSTWEISSRSTTP